jgi:hypothetical protein
MQVEPAQAQAMFVRDIAPDLHKLRGFALYRNKPGSLAFGDGRDLRTYALGEQGPGIRGPGVFMRRLSERRITVAFTAEATGTRVTLKGGAERDVRNALERLGEPGQWPDTADPPE